jgi:hypothetical protein
VSTPALAVASALLVHGATRPTIIQHRECRKALKPNSTKRVGVISSRGWKRKFEDPIPLPRGRQLVTLRDAARYITKLPKAEQQIKEWQDAVEALSLGRQIQRPDDARSHRGHESIEPPRRAGVQSGSQRPSLGTPQAEEGPMKTVLIYVNTSKQVGDVDHFKVSANEVAAEKWFMENDPEGVAFEYPVIGVGKD